MIDKLICDVETQWNNKISNDYLFSISKIKWLTCNKFNYFKV